MRRTKSSTSSANNTEKLYINSNTLSLRGEKLEIGSEKSRRGAVVNKNKQHKIEIESTPSLLETEVDRKKEAKNTIELKKCAPLCDDVVSRQVRKIRETVEVEDFERLLIGLTGAAGHVRKRGDLSEALGDIYHEFFGVYYEVLRDVVRNKMSSIT